MDFSRLPSNVLVAVLGCMSLKNRFNCALVCKAWAEAATAATRCITLEQATANDLSAVQHWLERHGSQVEVLQLHECNRAALTALPCAKLQNLLLHGTDRDALHGRVIHVTIGRKTWGDIASATKLTSLSLRHVQTASQQADVVAALTALPNLEQLTWFWVYCRGKSRLSDSSLLQHMTRLTFLDLQGVATAALQHLGSLTKLQHLSISVAKGWAAAGCPGLQELKALTSLELASGYLVELPASISQLTALQQLDVCRATPIALNQLQVLTALTHLCVWRLIGLSPESPPLQLPRLRHLQLPALPGWHRVVVTDMPMSFLDSCTQLQYLRLHNFILKGPGSLAASTVLQHLELRSCSIIAADGAADPASWQQVFPGPGRLPHLTYLELFGEQPPLQQADIEGMVACCSNLRVFSYRTLASSIAPALARLPGLTHLQLHTANDEACSAMVQLTGLRQLMVMFPQELSAVGLRQLTGLNQLTSLGFGKLFCNELDPFAKHHMEDKLPDCRYALINKAPSGSPPDVSSRLLDLCDVADACEAATASLREMRLSGPPGGVVKMKAGTAGSGLVSCLTKQQQQQQQQAQGAGEDKGQEGSSGCSAA